MDVLVFYLCLVFPMIIVNAKSGCLFVMVMEDLNHMYHQKITAYNGHNFLGRLHPAGEPPSPRAAHATTAVGTMVVTQVSKGFSSYQPD